MKVSLIAYTENADGLCARAAATCTQAKAPQEGSEKALKMAIESGHESVLEHASFTFMIEGVSRGLTHQLVRHRIGSSFSMRSQRYVKESFFDYVVPDSIKNHPDAYKRFYDIMVNSSDAYTQMVGAGIPQEDARYVLPNACCTNIVVTMNARELRHFFGLRCCKRAQWEIRELANAMLRECEKVAPLIFANAGAQCEQMGYCPEAKSCGKRPRLEEKMQKNAENSEEKVQKDNTFSKEKVCTYEGIMKKLDDIADRMTVYDCAISNGYVPARKKEKD